MRRALYDFFGLPRLPDVEPLEDEIEEEVLEAEIGLDRIRAAKEVIGYMKSVV